MVLFGRDTVGQRVRAESCKAWVASHSPYSIFSGMCGVLAVLDSFTVVIGMVLGVSAVVTGLAGVRDLSRRPHLRGRRLCWTGMALGGAGVATSLLMGWVVYPRL